MRHWEREIEKRYGPRGWRIERSANNHIRLVRPETPKFVSMSSTPRIAGFTYTDREVRRIEQELAAKGLIDSVDEFSRRGRPPVEAFTIREDHGQRLHTIVCSRCQASDIWAQDSRIATVMPARIVAHKFRSRGWRAMTKRSEDLCPNCVAGQPAQPNKPEAPPPAAPKLRLNLEALSHFEDNRRQQVEVNRAIFRLLDKVYVDYDTGYMAGESDETVARRLKIDVEQVAALRSDFFGPDLVESKEASLRRHMKAFRTKLAQFERITNDRVSQLQGEAKALLDAIAKVSGEDEV